MSLYHSQVSHPSVEDLFTSVTQDIEAKLNIMQATHLMLQTSQESNAGLKFFLFLKVCLVCVHLCAI